MPEPIELTSHDVCERSQSLFRYAQVGLCVNSVTHDINNYLGAILAYAELVDMSDEVSAEGRRMLREIIEGVRRCTGLLSTLTVVARKEKPSVAVLDPAKLLAQVLEVRAHDIRLQRVQLEQRIDVDTPDVVADHPKLELALIYLLSNAFEAVADQDVKIMRVGLTYTDNAYTFSFWNSGPEIPETDRASIFAPFTTSKPGAHLGLGLTMAHAIAAEHDGTLIYSPERGFLLTIPRENTFTRSIG